MSKYVVKYHVYDVAVTFITNADSAHHAKMKYIEATGNDVYDYLEAYLYAEDVVIEDQEQPDL